MEKDQGIKVVAVNRRASHQYEILEKFEAGLALLGSEVKSIREGRVNFLDSFVRVENGEAFVHNLHIGGYKPAAIFGHEPTRRRKLLLHRWEIRRLLGKTQEKGLTVIPLRLYFKNHLAKLEIAVARGKKEYDKREAIRRKEERRAISEAMKAKLRRPK
jgi:SsrA-binding protein